MPEIAQGQLWRSSDGRAALRRVGQQYVLSGEHGRSVVGILTEADVRALGEAALDATKPLRRVGPKETKGANGGA